MTRQTPAAVIFAFNRADLAGQLAQKVAAANPPIVFLCVDGPRDEVPTDAEACDATRRALDSIDWPCPVVRRYSSTNQGLRTAIPLGLSAVFDEVDRAIVLEDDCHPDASFFPFCGELLDRYEADQRVGMVRGTGTIGSLDTSYYFSRFTNIWGWATWADRWANFDFDMTEWPQARESGWVRSTVDDPHVVEVMTRAFDDAHSGFGHWDFKWQFACWRLGMTAATPTVNLVSNLGFGDQATTTTASDSPMARRSVAAMKFPLRHPADVVIDGQADRREFDWAFPRPNRSRRALRRLWTSRSR